MGKKVFLFISIALLFVACSPKEEMHSNEDLQTMEGIIAEKSSSRNILLIIPNIEPDDIEGLDEHALFELASKNGASYFYVSKEEFNAYELYDPVTVQYDANGAVEESDPPIRNAIHITLHE